MTIYVVAQLSFKQREAYQRYQARFWDVFRQYRGRLLAADERPSLLEGDWAHDKVVIMSFPDEDACTEFLHSARYEEISMDRRLGAQAVVIMVRGL